MTTRAEQLEQARGNRAVRAALFATHYAAWLARRTQEQQQPSPAVYIPATAKDAVPMPVANVKRVVDRAAQHPAHTRLCNCIDYDLGISAGNDELRPSQRELLGSVYSSVSSVLQQHVGQPSRTAITEDPSVAKPNVKFNEASWVATAVREAAFDNVPRELAQDFMDKASPPNWSKVARDFFIASMPCKWDPRRERPEPIDPERLSDFQLYEHVEWNWSEVSEGGAINILEITRFSNGEDKVDRHGKALPDGSLRLFYEYRLFHCLQTKLLTTWEQGGLDVDDGYYQAIWRPTGNGERGRLTVDALKTFRYNRGAEAVPGFSSLLNLLAPAFVSMLMGQLVVHGAREALGLTHRTHDDPEPLEAVMDTRPTQPSPPNPRATYEPEQET